MAIWFLLLSSERRKTVLAHPLSVPHATVCDMMRQKCCMCISIWTRCSAQTQHNLPWNNLCTWVLWCSEHHGRIWSPCYIMDQKQAEQRVKWQMGQNSTTQRASPKGKQIIVDVNYKLALAISTCHLPLQGLNHVLLLTFSTPWKEFLVGIKSEAIRAGTGIGGRRWTGQTGLQTVRYFKELILWAQFLYFLICRKALKSFIGTSAPCDK